MLHEEKYEQCKESPSGAKSVKTPVLVELNNRFQGCYGTSDDYLTEIERKLRDILQYSPEKLDPGPSARIDPSCALEEMLLRSEQWEEVNRRLLKISLHLREII